MSRRASGGSKSVSEPGFWRLIALGEPFRLLFPLGTLIGIFGVAMWPLYFWNLTSVYPGQVHARIMIEGFLTCFVLGFLGTALPRLLDVPRLALAETLFFAVCQIFLTTFHYVGQPLLGDQLFIFTLGYLLLVLGLRFLLRKDTPPPAFVLVLLGMASALSGAVMQVVATINPTALPPLVVRLSSLLLYQGYLLLPIMGIGAFLLPRFFGMPNRQNLPESLALTPEWKSRAAFALLCGGSVLVSFVLESLGQVAWGYGLRALAVLLYFSREVPVHRAGFGGGSLALALRISLLSIPVGYGLMAIWPDHSYSFLHIVFITGFSLLTFVVATRVVLGHGGKDHLFRASLPSVLILTTLVFLAMFARVTADWIPLSQMNYYSFAAIAWVAGVAFWGIYILPSVKSPDTE